MHLTSYGAFKLGLTFLVLAALVYPLYYVGEFLLMAIAVVIADASAMPDSFANSAKQAVALYGNPRIIAVSLFLCAAAGLICVAILKRKNKKE